MTYSIGDEVIVLDPDNVVVRLDKELLHVLKSHNISESSIIHDIEQYSTGRLVWTEPPSFMARCLINLGGTYAFVGIRAIGPLDNYRNVLDELKKGVQNDKILPSSKPKSPVLACILSLCIVGLGQLYLGQVKKGVVLFVATIIVSCFTFGVAWFILIVVGPLDAYMIGRKLKAGKSVDKWEFFAD